MTYKAVKNEIVDATGKQIAIVFPVSCSRKAANAMAAFCAQQMNHEQREKDRKTSRAAAEIGRSK